jgi:archaemetzincin
VTTFALLTILFLSGAQPEGVLLLPLGQIDTAVTRVLRHELARRFHQVTSVLPTESAPEYAFRWIREQYYAPQVLDSLARRTTANVKGQWTGHLLAVTDVDLYDDGLNFVFGQADLVDRVAVISLVRLREEYYRRPANPSRFRERAVREAVHEVGHTYGLVHCPDPRCVMHYSQRLADTDRKSSRFCRECRARLPHREVRR